MDVQKQIDYWRIGAEEDLLAVRALLEKGLSRHALFFAHLALEKMLKAHVSKATRKIPPKIHNLVRLAQIAGIGAGEKDLKSLRDFDSYQLQGRYPGTVKAPIDRRTARSDLTWADKMVKRLKDKL